MFYYNRNRPILLILAKEESQVAVAPWVMRAAKGLYGQPEGEQKVKNIPKPVVMAIVVVLAFFLLGSCAALIVFLLRPQSTATTSVSGVVTIQDQVALPQDAVVIVRIVDVTDAASPAQDVAIQTISDLAEVPLPYEVSYDSQAIDQDRNYAVRARINDGAGNLLFASKQDYPVITQGNPTSDVSVLVEPASAAQEPAPQPPAASAPGTGSVTGVVTHTVQMALPGDAVVFVQLTDVSQVDAPTQVIGDQTINNPGQAPIPFNLAYDPSLVDPGRTYAVQARITDGTGTVFMQTMTQYPVITQGNPASGVHVVVEPVSGADQPSVVASVTGTLTYREKVTLPSTAIAYVRLFDVTLGNVPTALIGEQTIVNPGQVPIPFDVKYDSGRIDQNHVYAIKASIEDGSGNMLFVTTRNYLVITQGQPTVGVEVILDRIYKGMGLCVPARAPCLNGD